MIAVISPLIETSLRVKVLYIEFYIEGTLNSLLHTVACLLI